MSQTFWMPPLSMLLPGSAFSKFTDGAGIRFGWMRAHTCPCTMSSGVQGAPDPRCKTCDGRGVYWDKPKPFVGFLTYMHTAAAPDEPGSFRDTTLGMVQRSEPTLTIPFAGSEDESVVWNNASTFDAYVEYDAPARLSTTMLSGEQNAIPYQDGLRVTGVTIYDPIQFAAVPLPETDYTVASGTVTLASSYPEGTAYTVEYFALPVYVAYRIAGGMAHSRPFGRTQGEIPKRFRLVSLDIWTRARRAGDGPMGGL